jgi:hypothetical protein
MGFVGDVLNTGVMSPNSRASSLGFVRCALPEVDRVKTATPTRAGHQCAVLPLHVWFARYAAP